MNILLLFDQTLPYINGGSIRSHYIAKSLIDLTQEVYAFSHPIWEYDEQSHIIDSVKYYHEKLSGWRFYKYLPLAPREKITAKIIAHNALSICKDPVQIVHAHTPYTNGWAAKHIAKALNIPFLYEMRGLREDSAVANGQLKEDSSLYKYTYHQETAVAQCADHITVICEGLKNDLINRGIPAQKVTVIPNGVDIKNFYPVEKSNELLDKYNLHNKIIIGYIGSLVKYEGLDTLIEAAKIMQPINPNIKYLIVGKGEDKENLSQIVKENNLADSVIFTGAIPHTQILDYYSLIDILVYPRKSSRVTEHITPLKPLEAMALKKLTIGSDVGGIKELIQNNTTGYLFKHNDSQDLAKKVHQGS